MVQKVHKGPDNKGFTVFTVRKALTLTLTLTLRSRRVAGRILKQKIDKLSGVSTGSS